MSRAGPVSWAASVCRDDFQFGITWGEPAQLMADAMKRGKPERAWFCILSGFMSRTGLANVITWKNLSEVSRDPGTANSTNRAGARFSKAPETFRARKAEATVAHKCTLNLNHSHPIQITQHPIQIQVTHTKFKIFPPNSNHSHRNQITHTKFLNSINRFRMYAANIAFLNHSHVTKKRW